ncbi:MAG: RNase adapter RapZ [Acidimicrobiia bacterium]|nr:RNase adapter RapZ [Acidimicrobiia bacterium]
METTTPGPSVVVITGLSGAGRSNAANVLEDIGYFVVDNLPVEMIPELVARVGAGEGGRRTIAAVADTRAGMNADKLDAALIDLQRAGLPTTVLFLDADNRTLARRFEETRRPHPVHESSLIASIEAERHQFEDVRAMAHVIVDTSDLSVHELRDKLRAAFADADTASSMRVDITSFGFKRGPLRVVDVMFDVRFLPNPYWIPELRELTGQDVAVKDFVFSHPEAGTFLSKVTDLLDFLIPLYVAEGKSYLTIGIGCTGGQHRSVALAEAIGGHLATEGVQVTVHHRDKPDA